MSRARRDGGAVVVETAIGLPILLLFVFGLVDLGRWSLEANQAANAARDGARAGIFSYAEADDDGSDQHQTIVEEVTARLDNGSTPVSVDVRCVEPDGTTIDCSLAVPDLDRLEVAVSWTLPLVTPVAGAVGRDEVTINAQSAMVLAGLPTADSGNPPATTTTTSSTSSTTSSTTTTTAGACAVLTGPSVSPDPVEHNSGSNKLRSNLTISFTTNGIACGTIEVELEAPDGSTTTLSAGSGPAHSVSYSKSSNDPDWTAGTATATVLDDGSPIASTTFEVE